MIMASLVMSFRSREDKDIASSNLFRKQNILCYDTYCFILSIGSGQMDDSDMRTYANSTHHATIDGQNTHNSEDNFPFRSRCCRKSARQRSTRYHTHKTVGKGTISAAEG